MLSGAALGSLYLYTALSKDQCTTINTPSLLVLISCMSFFGISVVSIPSLAVRLYATQYSLRLAMFGGTTTPVTLMSCSRSCTVTFFPVSNCNACSRLNNSSFVLSAILISPANRNNYQADKY